jgi:hypothetical protein
VSACLARPLEFSSFSPHYELLQRGFATPRRPTWRAELRETKAYVARAAGWVPEAASDAEALCAFRGRGRRVQLVRAVPAETWERDKWLKLLIEKCCEWLDYLRDQGIRTKAELEQDLRDRGIARVEPGDLFVRAFQAIAHEIHKAEPVYRRARARMGRIVLAKLWRMDEEAVKKLLQRWRGRRQQVRVVRLTSDFAKQLAARVDATSRTSTPRPVTPGASSSHSSGVRPRIR